MIGLMVLEDVYQNKVNITRENCKMLGKTCFLFQRKAKCILKEFAEHVYVSEFWNFRLCNIKERKVLQLYIYN